MRRRFRSLTEREFEQDAQAAFRAVFANADPFDQPLNVQVEGRALLFPVRYELSAQMMGALASAAVDLGDDGFFLSVLERPAEAQQDRPYHWFIPFDTLDHYWSLTYPFVLQSALFSPTGRWGLLISNEGHAVVGGPSRFVAELVGAMADSLDAQADAFLREWRDNRIRHAADVSWVPWLLTNIYGERRAAALIGNERDWLSTA